MYSAASSAIQNQVAGPLSYLLTGHPALSASAARISANNQSKLCQNEPSQYNVTTSKVDGISTKNIVESSNIFSILNPLSSNVDIASSSLNITETNALSMESSVTNLVNNFLGNSSSSKLLSLYGQKMSSKILSSEGFKFVPKKCKDEVKGILAHIFKQSQTKSLWHVSYVSNDSFLDNKHIAPPNSHCILNKNFNNRLLSRVLAETNIFSMSSVRGFKTLKSYEREASKYISVRERLRNKVSMPSENEGNTAVNMEEITNNSKLKNLLSESNAESEKQVKVAFAEGYLAAEGGPKKKSTRTMRWVKTFQQVLSVVVLLVLLASLMNTMGGSLFRLNVTNGNEVQPEDITESFEDVRGAEEAKLELEEIVEFLKCPEKFTSLGAELPKGVLLVGPPGTGKTLLARAVAGEAGVPFFHAAGPEFDEILVGQGARRVRDLFRAAKGRAPCVIFIDEIDSVGAKRTNSVLHPYANQTINQLLAEMDGFHKNEGVIVLGATNRRDDLDKALLRPGRFDVEVQVPIPDLAGRKEIFEYFLSKVKVGNDVEVGLLGRGTTGFTGADIKNVVNQAALRAAADLVDSVSMKHLESARDKVLMGPEKKSRISDEEVNKVTAYHEGGHTLVAHYTKHSHPLHKVTIIPRGHSLGHTAYIPAKEQYNVTRAQMMANLDSLMGGRAAEELVFGTEMVTSGASSDLKQATAVATTMVKDFGMSDKVGLRTFEDNSGQLMGGGESLSTSTKEAIDAEIKRLLQESYERAISILKTHAKEHKALAEALLKYETLDADDIKAILNGKNFSKDS